MEHLTSKGGDDMRLSGHLLPSIQTQGWTPALIGVNHIELAVVLRLHNEEQTFAESRRRGRPWQAEELAVACGIAEPDRKKLVDWLTSKGLALMRQSPFVLWLEGTFEEAAATLGIGFDFRSHGKIRLFRLNREPMVPDWAAAGISGIVGLENVVRHRSKWREPRRTDFLANQGQGFFPGDLEKAYQFPWQFDGHGQTLGLLEFSSGYSVEDAQNFWKAMNVPIPSLQWVSVDNIPNDGGVNPNDLEATLDVEWAGAMAPGARLVVYGAGAGTSDQSFGMSMLKALDYAYHDQGHHPQVLSISYGDAETRFPAAELMAWDTLMAEGGLLGVTTYIASGDEGAYGVDGVGPRICHVDAPACCPHAVSVGGTRLILNSNGSIKSETGWTDTNNNGASGGGISQVFKLPSYQSAISLPLKADEKEGRAVPDVSANADPDTGYAVYFQGAMTVVGGTSAATPLWAALGARLNQARAQNKKGAIGFLNGDLYNLGGGVMRDITEGNNNYAGVVGYRCTPGWDAVTGWGSPVASALIKALT